MSSKPIPLRPHHGMCLAYFVGHGYSSGFSAHMGEVLSALTPETAVRLTINTDVVCTACPHNIGGLCEKPEQVAAYDRAVLSRCDLKEGQVLPFGQFAARVQSCVLAPGHRPIICGECQWNDICRSQPSRWSTL